MNVTQLRVVASEWTKFRSLPSTIWSLLVTGVLIVGFGAIFAMLRVTRPPKNAAAAADFDPTVWSLSGMQFAQISIGVLGVLLITGEYATGTIRGSLSAVPSRLPVLWGKAIVFGLVTAVLSIPAALVAFTVAQGILADENLDTSLGADGVLRAVLGSAAFLALIGLLGLGLGALIRNTAGAISALFGILFGLPILAGFLPSDLAEDVTRFLPTSLATAVASVHRDADSLGPAAAFGAGVLWVGALLAVAAWQLRRRDV